ncbi:MAG: TolC family protein [Saprospiraceae bacterium]|nr:TolC family protein [Saprospiraceae bacterium]
MNIRNLTLALSLILTGLLSAQNTVLTSDDAVKMALENNFGIRLSREDAQLASINNTKGNAGLLPTVNLVANENFTLSAFQQVLANGSEFNAFGAPFNTANAGVQLSWTLFDGRRMHIAKDRLEQTESLGQINLQATIQSSVASVLQAYYDIVRSKLQQKAISEIIQLNEERLKLAEARVAAGFAAQTDALQAQIDLNQRKSDLLQQESATNVYKRALNNLLGRAPGIAFEVEEEIQTSYDPERNNLLERIYTQNPDLQSLEKTAEIAALTVREINSLGKARITGNAQFNAVRSDNGSGFALNNTQAGFTVGASLIVPLYTGGNVKRQVEGAKINATKARIQVESLKLQIETALDNQLEVLQTQQNILNIETQNVDAARENLSISSARFEAGTTNGLEIQSAQNSLEQALVRKNLVLYNLKIAELQLKLLVGEL